MIPLSLYVTVEFAKMLQVYHINNNAELYDPLSDKRLECRALNITEELGQVRSDVIELISCISCIHSIG
jgi:phospholipid-translocating ATPase